MIGDWNLNVKKWIQNGNRTLGWKFQGLTDDLHDKCINLGKIETNTSNIPVTNKDPLEYIRDYVARKNFCTFEFPTCNVTRGVGYKEIKEAIKSLKNTTASGVDNLNTKFIKMLRSPLLHVLTCICNLDHLNKEDILTFLSWPE